MRRVPRQGLPLPAHGIQRRGARLQQRFALRKSHQTHLGLGQRCRGLASAQQETGTQGHARGTQVRVRREKAVEIAGRQQGLAALALQTPDLSLCLQGLRAALDAAEQLERLVQVAACSRHRRHSHGALGILAVHAVQLGEQLLRLVVTFGAELHSGQQAQPQRPQPRRLQQARQGLARRRLVTGTDEHLRAQQPFSRNFVRHRFAQCRQYRRMLAGTGQQAQPQELFFRRQWAPLRQGGQRLQRFSDQRAVRRHLRQPGQRLGRCRVGLGETPCHLRRGRGVIEFQQLQHGGVQCLAPARGLRRVYPGCQFLGHGLPGTGTQLRLHEGALRGIVRRRQSRPDISRFEHDGGQIGSRGQLCHPHGEVALRIAPQHGQISAYAGGSLAAGELQFGHQHLLRRLGVGEWRVLG